ncbi:MAG: hypothetical protein K2Y31_15250 [Burkholderiales bacterium]|jgi:hypothetical protein|nr:hypothetical protein [Burkholderiales bacterium]
MKPLTISSISMISAAVLAALPQITIAQTSTGGNALTIYSSARPGAVPPELYRSGGNGQAVPGYAVVRQQRDLSFNRGRNTVRFTDVAALIDSTTVSFQSLTDPTGTSVIEQNFQFDLVSVQKMMEKYIDRRISVDQVRGNSTESFSGTLLSTSDSGLVLKRDDGGIQTLPHNAGVRLPELPGGLITKPALVWDVNANRAGTHNTQVSYQTTGITWWTDYNVTHQEGTNANSCKLDVAAWVSIINQSGASYPDAKLKLVAGDVQRAQPQGRVYAAPQRAVMASEMSAKGFEEKEFFEYHLYTLGRPTTLPDNSTKQIELFPAVRAVPCEKNLVYTGAAGIRPYGSPATDRNYGVQSNKKVDVYLSFKNAKEQNMGMPLPAGRIRVSKLDETDKTLEFIGEDVIDHTPRNEQLLIKLGSAFDVVGERRQVNFTVDTSRKTMTEEIEVKLRNQKKEAVTVIVKENLYRWSNWQITTRSHDYRKDDARTVTFPVKIAAEAEAALRYSVTYTW